MDLQDAPNLASPARVPVDKSRLETRSRAVLGSNKMATPSVYAKADNSYFSMKKPSGRAGVGTRHPAVSRRALGVHNTSCDINALVDENFIANHQGKNDSTEELYARMKLQ